MSSVWRQIHRMKRFTIRAMATPEYYEWWSKRVNDNIPEPGHENSQTIEEHLRVVRGRKIKKRENQGRGGSR
ncbi:hypothetical protein Gotri_005848 [Gossypium trilobum]|uniref:Uncharacterized protein n=1 Tax=Gossypium trilobum TaxID=34281 RepID=A0A7J9EYW2_9ROSI|nr:hypothetical protein [Gossypium trilobum]